MALHRQEQGLCSRYLEELPFTGMISACGATIEKDGERLFNKEMPPEVAKISGNPAQIWSGPGYGRCRFHVL